MRIRASKAAALIAGAIAVMGLAGGAQAALVASESFSYGLGNTDITTYSGGFGWTAGSKWTTGSASITKNIVDAGMSYTPSGGSAISGGGESLQAVLVSNATTVVARTLATAQTGTLYYSYLVKVPAGKSLASGKFAGLMLSQNEAVDYNSPMAGLRPNSTFTAGTYPNSNSGLDENPFLARWRTSGTLGPKENGYTEDTTFLIVAKLSKSIPGTGTFYDTMDFWVNPSATQSLTIGSGGYAGQALQPGGANPPTLTSVTQVSFRADGSASNTIQWDELKIGTEWVDVVPVPEPATAIAGVGMLALLGRRRRLV